MEGLYNLCLFYFSVYLISFASSHSRCDIANESCVIEDIFSDTKTGDETISTREKITLTGLEFLESEEVQLDLDIDIFSSKSIKNSGMMNEVLELVQKFIRNLKGLPIENTKLPQNNKINDNDTSTPVKPDWCFDPYKLKDLVVDELIIYRTLKEISTQNQATLAVKSYFEDIEDSTLRALRYFKFTTNESTKSEDDKYLYVASHPFLVYRMIRRFAEDLPPIFLQLGVNSSDLLEDIKYRDVQLFPNDTDLLDAIESIYRIQNRNLLSTLLMANGILGNVDTGIKLTALDSLELGAFYLAAEQYAYAIEWLHFAMETARQSLAISKFPAIEEFFMGLLEFAINKHNKGHSRKVKDVYDPRVFTERVVPPFDPKLYTKMIDYLKMPLTEKKKETRWHWGVYLDFRRVCSGERFQSEEERAKLSCWYETSRNLYWLINPLKMELLNLEPEVLQIYDVIGDQLIERMKSIGSAQLSRSLVADGIKANTSMISKSRTSSQVWIDDREEDGAFLSPLSKRLEFLSGLKIVQPLSSDKYQVALYGPSHHFDVHSDVFSLPNLKTERMGNRITTIMGYLSNVDVGGRTAFPLLGFAAEPVKGSILMWNNLKRTYGEEGDHSMLHGGCPVVLGIKWSKYY